MPPFDLWLSGRDDIFTWWFGPGIGCKGSRVIPTGSANGSPAFGQYKPSDRTAATSRGRCRCSSSQDGRIAELTFFLDTDAAVPALRAAAAARLRSTCVEPGEPIRSRELVARRPAAGAPGRAARGSCRQASRPSALDVVSSETRCSTTPSASQESVAETGLIAGATDEFRRGDGSNR